MKKWRVGTLILSILIAGTVLAGGCAPAAPVVEGQTIVDVSAPEAYGLIQENLGNPDFVILDVRTPEEYDEGHIEDALLVNFNAPAFRDKLDNLDREKSYLLFCRSGSRSGRALTIMSELEFLNIYHMTGGMIEWNGEGLPVVW